MRLSVAWKVRFSAFKRHFTPPRAHFNIILSPTPQGHPSNLFSLGFLTFFESLSYFPCVAFLMNINHLAVHVAPFCALRLPTDMARPPVHLALGSCGGLKFWLHLPPGEQWSVKQPSQIARTTDVSIPHDCADVISI